MCELVIRGISIARSAAVCALLVAPPTITQAEQSTETDATFRSTDHPATVGGSASDPVPSMFIDDTGDADLFNAPDRGSQAPDPCASGFADEFSYPGGFVQGGGDTPSRIFDYEVFDDGTGPKLFMAGEFLIMGGSPGGGVAMWDGNSLRTVGLFQSPQGSGATSLAVFDDGSESALYFAGSDVGNSDLGRVGTARWDGENWSVDFLEGSPLLDSHDPPAFVQIVRASSAGGESALYFADQNGRIVRWDGQSWSPLGELSKLPSGSGLGRVVDLVAIDRGNEIEVFVAGVQLRLSDPLVRHSVVRWDGSEWSPAEAQLEPPVRTLEVFPGVQFDTLLAGTVLGVQSLDRFGIWRTFAALPALPNGEPAIVNDMLIRGDRFDREVWVSGRFANNSPFLPGDEAIVGRIVDGQLETMGPHKTSTLASVPLGLTVESFDDGSGESIFVGGAFNYLQSLFFDPFFESPSGLSDLRQAGGVNARSIARWDGANFHSLGQGLTTSEVDVLNMANIHDLAVHDDGSGPALFAGGDVALRGGVGDGVIRRAGDSWQRVDEPLHGVVHALASSGGRFQGELFAAGVFQPEVFSPERETRVTSWDGLNWSKLPDSEITGLVRDLVISGAPGGDRLLVAGAFSAVGAVPASNLAAWDGASWSEFAGGTDGAVSALLIDEVGVFGEPSGIVAGGEFTFAGGVMALSIAHWDRGGWNALGDGLPGVVSALAFFDRGSEPELYAGGVFELEVGAAPNIARWDGAAWRSLPDSENTEPPSVEVTTLLSGSLLGRPVLAVGGIEFTGGQLAGWTGQEWLPFGAKRPFSNPLLRCGSIGCGPRAMALADDADGFALWVGGRFLSADENNDSLLQPKGASSITNWTDGRIPRIAQHPVAEIFASGPTAILSLEATDPGADEPLLYHWRREGVPLSNDQPVVVGVFSPTLTISPVRAFDEGDYSCVVSNSCGDDISRVVRLDASMAPDCPGDADRSGDVGFTDLTRILERWGVGLEPPDERVWAITGDANGDGVVDFRDITTVLANWQRVCL